MPRMPGLYALIIVGLATIHLEYFVGPRGRDHRPVLITLKIEKRDSARRFQEVSFASIDYRDSLDGEKPG